MTSQKMDYPLSPITILCIKKTTNLLTENFALLLCLLIPSTYHGSLRWEFYCHSCWLSFRILYCKCGYICYCIGLEAPHGWQMHISTSILCLTNSYTLVWSFKSALQRSFLCATGFTGPNTSFGGAGVIVMLVKNNVAALSVTFLIPWDLLVVSDRGKTVIRITPTDLVEQYRELDGGQRDPRTEPRRLII